MDALNGKKCFASKQRKPRKCQKSHFGNQKEMNEMLGLVWFKKMVTHHSVFVTHHSSLSFHHSSLITHYSSLKTPHSVWHYHSFVITQYFSTICGPHSCTCAAFTLFIYFFPSTSNTQTHRTSKKK